MPTMNDKSATNLKTIESQSLYSSLQPAEIAPNILVQNGEKDVEWTEYLRDETTLLKVHKNKFGSKEYALGQDKSTLSQHVSKIVRSNLDNVPKHLPKPFLKKNSSSKSRLSSVS